MAGVFSNLFGKKGQSVIGIDVGSSAIKVVQLSRKGGRAILETYGELSLGPYTGGDAGRATNLPPEKLSAALKDLLREAKVTTSRSALSIPYSSSLVTMIEMPAVPEKRLAEMLPIEARKYIPVPLSEVSLDWWVIPKSAVAVQFGDKAAELHQGEKLDILLVAIHNETLRRQETIMNQASLSAAFFEIEIFSAIRSVLEQDTASHMIIDLGAASTKIYIVERGVVRGSHVVNRGSQDITLALSNSLGITIQNAEIWKRTPSEVPASSRVGAIEIISLTLDPVFSEASRILLNYEKRYNKSISRVTLVGGGARLDGIGKLAALHLQTEITLGNPFGKAEAPAFLEDVLKRTGPEFAVSVGLALRLLQETQ